VRKPILTVLAASLLVVPAAFAATADEEPAGTHTKLVSPTVLDKHWRRAKHELKRAERRAKAKRGAAREVATPPQLEAIAQCESHGDPRAIGGGGAYRGKYQFDTGTWASVGGKGDPAAAPEAEQDRRAAILYARSGPGQWPVCGA
jgi:transglycosylase-like protein